MSERILTIGIPTFNRIKAITSCMEFLENKNLPITEDGCFLAYKAVTSDYKDKWTQQIDNSVGETVSMPRRKVNDDCGMGCADGLHCGAIEYVEGYRSEHSGDRVGRTRNATACGCCSNLKICPLLF